MVAVSRNQSKLDELRKKYPRVEVVALDLGDWKQTERKLAKACEKVDFLVNNAGLYAESEAAAITEQEVDELISVNLKAPINLIRLCVKGMKERKFGCIVNVSSSIELVPTGQIVFNATKGGLDRLTQVLAIELSKFNIRVNAIVPSVVLSENAKAYMDYDTERRDKYLARIPMQRFGEVDEFVRPIIFLLGEGSTIINGILMPIDGGFAAT